MENLLEEIDLLFGDKMRRAAQLPTLSWHGRSSAVGLPPCSLPPQDLGRVLDGGPIRHGVDSQQLVVPGSPPTACTGIQQGCQLVCPAAGTFWWCWLSPFVLHPAPPMSPHDLLLLKRLRIIPQNSTMVGNSTVLRYFKIDFPPIRILQIHIDTN